MRFAITTLIILLFSFEYVSANDAEEALTKLFQEERAAYYKENPGTGPIGADMPIGRKFQGVSEADHQRRAKFAANLRNKLYAIDRNALSATSQLNYDMFDYLLSRTIVFAKHRTWRIPFYSDSGFHTAPTRIWQSIRFNSKDDYYAYIDRLNDLPRYFDEHIENMRAGVRDDFTMPKVVLDGLMPTFGAHIVSKPEDSVFFGAFREFNSDIPEGDQNAILTAAKAAILNSVVPAYQKLNDFMQNEYYPAARTDLAASNTPNGKAYYEAMVKFYTTLDISPDEVHELGLKEVARIRSEMEDVIKDAKFEGSFNEFTNFLRSDPQFYAKTEEELLMNATFIAKEIDGKMPAFFGKLPRQPYGVEAVPASLAPNYTTGRYSGSPLNAPRGGYYWVNTYALHNRPLYNLRALTLHEAVPGHHHQSALSKELENVPEFRLGLYPHAFGEGWGLYSEKLGIEMGIYKTPYDHFGRLSYEMWRACRLVIDTGIHYKGWSRDQAIKLLEENSALSKLNIRTEVDRYISWPGQALAYKMGELKILELRKRAKDALENAFDIREFHDQVLSAGGVPLNVLERRIVEWIERKVSDSGQD
ncbi:DUF885 family protein [Kordiimonas sp. SCSIO 12610]|uniref:DUF885 domain-containing protein n=1 Tax=Kordiimonas sp. SCSIO 12610 TaxID=2829597 RepID=UPI00210D2FBA|nr:DUF885 domain-containing protein [Kordiimonas sp. SCSIO 12610]UTW56784.1 DUF885 domain-containing protein [Kordiimonas sp. SCSIO 12610]